MNEDDDGSNSDDDVIKGMKETPGADNDNEPDLDFMDLSMYGRKKKRGGKKKGGAGANRGRGGTKKAKQSGSDKNKGRGSKGRGKEKAKAVETAPVLRRSSRIKQKMK